ncbi:MAG TPA: NAD(P)/FAD-dependent oxidoreductase [Gammaproteobacteria bacterium]|nr:NAD(P)/FAD-dependent oxidoreductase [Gammaproteobacteria bacterium]
MSGRFETRTSRRQGDGFDALIIGAGHNGLVCACYLARAGLKVKVLERRALVGGAAVTEEFHPGFRNSTASYTVSLLHPKIIRDLHLHQRGLTIVHRPLANFLPLPDGRYFRFGDEDTAAEVRKFSARDADRLPAFMRMLATAANALRDAVLETPPNAGGGVADLLRLVKTGRRLARLPIEAQRDLLALFTKSAGEVLDHWFESDVLKAVFGFNAIVGNFASPYDTGSAYVLLHHEFGEVNGKRREWGHAIGGMGTITNAMAAEAKSLGVEIATRAAVTKVMIEDGLVLEVELEDGSQIRGRCVVANINPKLLYLQLIDKPHLDADFLSRIQGWKCASATFRMNVALSELPDFSALPGKNPQAHHGSGIILGPSLAYMDAAYHDAKQYGWSRAPVVEIVIPSTVDGTLAPKNMHVAPLFCQHFNPELPNGASWDTKREQAVLDIIRTVDTYAPNFKKSIIGYSALSPLDLEREFGLIGGDIFHGALSLDQLYSARPVLGHGDYRGPLKRLYMCGSGTHPGGGVTGAPGHNAAREIIRDFRYRLVR